MPSQSIWCSGKTAQDICSTKEKLMIIRCNFLVVFICFQLCHNYIRQSISQSTSKQVSFSNKVIRSRSHLQKGTCGFVKVWTSSVIHQWNASRGISVEDWGSEEEFGWGWVTRHQWNACLFAANLFGPVPTRSMTNCLVWSKFHSVMCERVIIPQQ